MSGGSVGITGK